MTKPKRRKRVRAWLVVGFDDSILSSPGPHWYRESAAKQCPPGCRVVSCEITYDAPPAQPKRRKGVR